MVAGGRAAGVQNFGRTRMGVASVLKGKHVQTCDPVGHLKFKVAAVNIATVRPLAAWSLLCTLPATPAVPAAPATAAAPAASAVPAAAGDHLKKAREPLEKTWGPLEKTWEPLEKNLETTWKASQLLGFFSAKEASKKLE